jgi:hypothetical protein
MSVIYRNVIAIADKFVPPKLQPLWNHEAGKLFLLRLPAETYLTKAVSVQEQWRLAHAHCVSYGVGSYVMFCIIPETAGSLRMFTVE